MDAYGTARLAAKDAESAIVARICEDFNLTPVLARAHYEQMARYFADYGHVALRPGELCYLAVASEEPPGKPIAACRKVQVALELAAPEDLEVLRTGLAAMRQQRLARLARQAQVQGGLLTVEDLAFLTCSSPATVKRDLAECRVNDIAVPTRGQIRDIGPGVSHKAQVVQLYLLAFNRGVARHNADPGPAARRLGLIAHFDGFAERYQSEDIAQFARRSADLTFDRVAAFMEMCPALVVDRDRDSRSQFTAQLDGVARGHGVSNRPGDRELHPAHVHDRNVDVESIGNLADAVVEHGVA